MIDDKNIAIAFQNVHKQFKSDLPLALTEISVNIFKGHITGLVGPDGAGKTTFIRLITGLLRPTLGNILVSGFDTVKAQKKLDYIIGYMPQKFGLYEDLTVMENLELYAKLRGLSHEEKEDMFKKMLDFTGLSPFTSRLAGRLSGGMKQKLGLACVLLGHPKILLLDEPSVGVDPISRRELWKMVQTLVKEEITVLWSTAYLDEAELCQKVILLNEGKLLFEGYPSSLTARVEGRVYHTTPEPKEKRKMLLSILKKEGVVDSVIQGQRLRILLSKTAKPLSDLTLTPTKPRFEDAFIDILEGKFSRDSLLVKTLETKPKTKIPPIQAHDLTKQFDHFIAAKDISFSVKQGEIFGLLGPNGAGKSTTFKMLCGLLQATHGKAILAGIEMNGNGARARTHIGYMAQKFSLYGDLSVKQNLDFFSGVYGLYGQKRTKQIAKMIDLFSLTPYLKDNAKELPLGYKQRLSLSCALMHEPDVLFLDEPTSGVDPLERREFWTHINGMVLKGVTIMITTHFMDEAEYCDRIALVYRGSVIAIDTPDALKARAQSQALPEPSLEEAFIHLVQTYDNSNERESFS